MAQQLWAVVHSWEGDVTVEVLNSEREAQDRLVQILLNRVEFGHPKWDWDSFLRLAAQGKFEKAIAIAKQTMKLNESAEVQYLGEPATSSKNKRKAVSLYAATLLNEKGG